MTHIAKIVYFGAVLTATEAEGLSITVVAVAIAAAITGTTLARPVLERLSDHGFRNYTR